MPEQAYAEVVLVRVLPSPFWGKLDSFNVSLGLLWIVQQIILVSYASMLGVSQ